MSTTRAVWLFVAALTAIRFSLLATTDLSFDEAHYWMWSERLAPAYFSKGPGIAFAIRASTAVFGANEFGVRFFSPVLAAATSLLLFYFARRLFGATAGLWTVIALNATPIFNIGAIVMTIDALSIFFWMAAMFTFWLAVENPERFRGSWYWPVTGLLIGLGFLCKYTNAFELISVLLVLALVPRLRREFKRPGVYLLIGMFVLCTIPPIVWNAQHAWITLAHLRSRGNLDRGFGFHPAEVLSFLGQHFIVYSPLLFLALAWGVIASWRRINQQFKVLFLMWFGLPVFGFYLLLSLNKSAAPNWDGLAFFGFGLVATYFWWERLQASVLLRICASVAVLVGLIMSWSHWTQICCGWPVTNCRGAIRVIGCADGKARRRRWKKCATILKRNWARNSFSLLTLAIARRKFRFICTTNEWKARGIRPFTFPNRRTW